MKKEVSDHLAKVFFETNRQEGRKEERRFIFFIALSIALVAGFILAATFAPSVYRRSLAPKNASLGLQRFDGPYLMKFDFTGSVAQTAVLNIDLPDVDASGFTGLRFSARLHNADARSLGALKVGLVNKRRETATHYFSDITPSWKKLSFPFSLLTHFTDRSNIVSLQFSLEPWNTRAKRGVLVIDDICFIKN